MQKYRSLFRHGLLLIALLTSLVLVAPVRAQNRAKIEIVPMLGHTGSITSVTFSPDGTRVLSGSSDKTIKLWDVVTGALIRSWEGHPEGVQSVAFSPDGTRVLSGGGDSIKLWDAATGALIRTFKGHSSGALSVTFSADGTRVLSGSWDNTVKLWDAATGAPLRTFKGHSRKVYAVAISPDGTRVLSGSEDKTIKLWDAATGALLRTFKGHSREVYAVAISPDGTRILSGSWDKTIKLWDAATGVVLRTFEGHSAGVRSVSFSPDGTRVLSGSWDKTIKLWNAATGALLRNFEGYTSWVISPDPGGGMIRSLEAHSSFVSSVAFSPDGGRVLSGSSDNTVKLWDTATGALIRSFEGHSAPVSSVAFLPDGGRVLSGSVDDNSIRFWDAGTGALLRTYEGHLGVTSVAVSPDGARILSGNLVSSNTLWDTTTGAVVRTYEGQSGVTSVAFSQNGSVLSGGSDGSITLWEGITDKLRSFKGHSNRVTSVAFSTDGARALSGSWDNTVKLWDTATGALIRTYKGHSNWVTSVAFSPDGARVLSGSLDGSIKLWDAATGALIRTFVGHSNAVGSVAFSPDGTRVLSGSWDNTLKLWDAATGALIRTLEGHSGWVQSVAFSPDGARALSGSADGTVRIWKLATGEPLVSLISGPHREWLSITPAGFFSASRSSTELLSIVQGFKVTAIDQVWQSLFNPDLVRQALAGDPDGEVRDAANVINLEKVLDSGPAPLVEITSQPSTNRSDADLITISARIKDGGKGIGRIEWRINGITAGVTYAPAGAGPVYQVTRELALDPGENVIEIVAYNSRNLLASLSARTTIAYTGPADIVKPNLYVLAIGINRYVDRGWSAPGPDEGTYFPKLTYAVADASAFAEELEKASEGFYGKVRVTKALDEQATRANLDRIIDEIAAEIQPRDAFVIFAAAHGYSIKQSGRFYLIPQDYQGGTNPAALVSMAIDEQKLQDWVANRIKAKKGIILLDTCRSGALTAGYTRSRIDERPTEASIGRLHEATGRPVLTAAAAGEDAQELVKLGHGVFTTALIDALHHGDSNGNGLIEISELAAHVEKLVPKLAAGGEVRTAIGRRGADEDSGAQSAHFGSTGGDFALVKRLP